MAGVLKKTTGLTGLAVSKLPHRDLMVVYNKLLRVLATLPESSAYRKHTEKLVLERVDIVNKTPNAADIESKIGCGQVEELLVQAHNELSLARNMTIWKPWEKLVEDAPPHQWTWPPMK